MENDTEDLIDGSCYGEMDTQKSQIMYDQVLKRFDDQLKVINQNREDFCKVRSAKGDLQKKHEILKSENEKVAKDYEGYALITNNMIQEKDKEIDGLKKSLDDFRQNFKTLTKEHAKTQKTLAIKEVQLNECEEEKSSLKSELDVLKNNHFEDRKNLQKEKQDCNDKTTKKYQNELDEVCKKLA